MNKEKPIEAQAEKPKVEIPQVASLPWVTASGKPADAQGNPLAQPRKGE